MAGSLPFLSKRAEGIDKDVALGSHPHRIEAPQLTMADFINSQPTSID